MDRASQSQRLLQAGVALFLAAVLLGLAIPHLAVPRLALAAHLVGILQGLVLLVVGLVWGRLNLTPRQLLLAFCLVLYQAVAAPGSNLLAAAWGAGNSIVPMAAGAAHGSAAQEAIINFGLRSSAAALIGALLLILWGCGVRRRRSGRGIPVAGAAVRAKGEQRQRMPPDATGGIPHSLVSWGGMVDVLGEFGE